MWSRTNLVMRSYRHTIDEEHLRRELAGPWSEALRHVRAALAAEPTASFSLNTALDVYFQGVCFAWALNDQNALGQLRQEISNLTTRTLDLFPAADVQQHSDTRTLGQVAVAADVAVVRRFGDVLKQGTRRRSHDMDPYAYRGDLLDGLTALILGDDAEAQAASTRIYDHLQHPRTPPGVFLHGIPHAIDAVARRDQPALDDAADFTIEQFVEQRGPRRSQPAGSESLLYPTLSLVYRTAGWQGMSWPDDASIRAYVLAVPDPIVDSQPEVELV